MSWLTKTDRYRPAWIGACNHFIGARGCRWLAKIGWRTAPMLYNAIHWRRLRTKHYHATYCLTIKTNKQFTRVVTAQHQLLPRLDEEVRSSADFRVVKTDSENSCVSTDRCQNKVIGMTSDTRKLQISDSRRVTNKLTANRQLKGIVVY